MNILDIAVDLFSKQMGNSSGLKSSLVKVALESLVGDGKGGINLQNIISGLNVNGLSALASSWLGNGKNSAISAADIMNLFGNNKISQFASSLNISTNDASNGLAGMMPKLIDSVSSDGALLSGQLDGVLDSGMLNKVASFFK